MARRVLLLGVDGLILPLAQALTRRGRLPAMERLFREGAVTKLLPFVSTWGPINWMCFATGAPPGSSWRGRVSVPSLDQGASGAESPYLSETLWDALSRQGRSSVVLAYPGSWPTRGDGVTLVVPDGQSTDLPPLGLARPARCMSAGMLERHRQPPGTMAGWAPIERRGVSPPSAPPLDVDVICEGWCGPVPPGARATSLAILGHDGAPVASIGVLLQASGATWCVGRDAGRELCPSRLGEWSDWVTLTTARGDATVRFKLLEVGSSPYEVALCHSEVFPVHGATVPGNVGAALASRIGPYASGSSARLRPTDAFWETAAEEARYEVEWTARAALALTQDPRDALFCTVVRAADAANHDCLAYLDPSLPASRGKESELAWEILAQAYGAVDCALGMLMDGAGSDTVVALASDHGAVVNHVTCDIYHLLQQEGLLRLRELEEGGYAVDWERTQVYVRPTRSGSELFINLAGREPRGIVQPEHYERVQSRLVDLLLAWREPVSETRAVALALRHRDAALLGYWGPEAGDVQFIYNEGFVWGELPRGVTIARTDVPAVNHGPQIPTAERGLASNMGMLALWGPGVRRGHERDVACRGPGRMTDPAATISALLEAEPPRACRGSILGDMLD